METDFLICKVRVTAAGTVQTTSPLIILKQGTLWRRQNSRMRLQETGKRKFRWRLRDRDPGVGSRLCQDSVSECAKSPSHPCFTSELEKGKEVGWVLRLNKGTEENRAGRGRDTKKAPQERIAEHVFHIHFIAPHFYMLGNPFRSCDWYF